MANLVPKVNNTGSLGTSAKKWSNVHTTTLSVGAQASALSLNSQKITNLATPTAAADAATKAYVDDAVQGLSAKDSVRAATDAPGTLASAFANGQTVDGVTLATGDRVLLKNQTAGAENGIYTVNASGAPTRAVDFDANAEVAKGAFIFVEEGTANANAGFVLTTDGAITLGTTALAFTQFSGAGQITAGDGLAKSGNTLSVDIPGSAEMTGDVVDTDELLISDGGTLKRADFSVVRDAVFADVSGNATVAAGGALSLASAAITGQTAKGSVADNDLILIADSADSNNLKKMTKATFVSGLGGGGLANVVEDTTPQLGGSLDVNGQDIVSVSNGNITLTPNGSGVVRIDGTSGIDLQSGEIAVKNSGSVSNIKLYCENSNSHYTQIQSAAHATYTGNVTLTLPITTGTLVGSGDSGTVTNTMLAGSIANGKLANSAVTVTAGNGLSGGGSVALGATTSLALDLNELTAAVVDVAADSIVIVDANDSNASKKESIADLVAGVAGTGLSASSGQLLIDGTVTTLAGTQTLTNKTLTSAVLNTGVSGTAVLDEDDMNSNSATKLATQQSIKAYVDTQVAGSGLNIDGYTALGGTGLHQSEDHFVFSDNGTEKKITFSNLEDAIFANISGDATIAAGGVLTIGANAVEGSMLNNNTISGQTEMTGDVADADELLISDAGTLKRADFSVVRDAVFNDVSGDATIAAGGALTIAATSVENSMLAGSITASKMNNAIFADLETLGAPASDGQFIVATGSGAFAYESANTARTSLGLGTGDSPTFTSLTLSGQAANLAMNNNRITGLATPTANGDAATKNYVDSVAQGLDIYDSVKASSTASFTMASTASATTLVLADGEGGFDATADTLTIDGVSLSQNDRVLIKNGVNSNSAGVSNKWNGIYTVGSLSGATLTLTRASDMDVSGEFNSGAFFFVEQGTVNADNGFVLTTDGTVTVGTSDIEFSQFSGAGDITAGDALTKSGNTLNVAVDDSSIEVSADALRVKASGITSAMLAGSIANSKLNTISTANKVALSSLDLDGGTDIGADLVDADLVIVDDGAGGTNRKSALSRMKKYIFSAVSGDATASDTGALTIASGAVETAMVNANVLTGQTAETSIADDDLVLIYDTSATALRKMTKANFVSGLSGATAADDISTGDAAVTLATSSGNITLDAQGSDTDIIFKGTDGGVDTTFLTLDGSAAGAATFNAGATIGGHLLPSVAESYNLGGVTAEWANLYLKDNAYVYFGEDQDVRLYHNPDEGLSLSMPSSASGTYEPKFTITTENGDTNAHGPTLRIQNYSTSGTYAGKIDFYGENASGQIHQYAYIRTQLADTTAGAEEGNLEFYVQGGSNGGSYEGLRIEGTPEGCTTNIPRHNGSDEGLTLGGTLVTATAAEINVLDGVTAGTVTASKALVVDSNRDLSAIRNLTVDGDITLDDGGSIKEAGGTAAITIDASGEVTKIGQDSPSSGQFLKWDGSKAVWDAASGGGSATIPDVQVVTANTSAAFASSGSNGDNERIYLVNNGSTAVTVTLPAVSGNSGKMFQIKRLGTANVTVAVQTGESLETTTNGTFVLTTQYSSVSVVCNASGIIDGWYII